jgi:hypothetical protein
MPSKKICIVARQDRWSRFARRKERAGATLPNSDPPAGGKGLEQEEDQRPVLLVAHVWVEECKGDADASESKGKGARLVVQWKRGHDAQAFEGFASHVGRKMREATEAEVLK